MSSVAHGQGDTTKLDSVTVHSDVIDQSLQLSLIHIVRVKRRLATDVGQIMCLFTGVQTKSYGGLGGMKTVTFRSLGSGHISTVYDGFTLSQTQSGQTDLGQLPVDFIQTIKLVACDPMSLKYPVHAKLAGQIISIETQHVEQTDSFDLKLGSQIGSFGQLDGHIFVAKQLRKWRFALSGKARRFDGMYPFTYTNGFTQVSTMRKNGDLKDVFGTASITWNPKPRQRLHLSYNGTGYNKGLPGAVVYYNENTVQRLFGDNHQLNFRHQGTLGKWHVASGISAQQSVLNYVDSNFLNSLGYLHSHFLSQECNANSQWRLSFQNDSIQFLFGTGARFERLLTKQYAYTPSRLSTDFIAAMEWKWHVLTRLQLGLQDVNDFRANGSTKKTFAFQPTAEIVWIARKISVIPGYRYTVRQPSFNELYYNQIGNEGLHPERAHLLYTAFRYAHYTGKNERFFVETKIQPFYVQARNKILAIPTKNLFIWSIQNIGKSDAWGTELTQLFTNHAGKLTYSLRLQYTFQYTLDLSDPNSPTYRHVLSYAPLHAGTGELDFQYNKLGLSILATYQGERYALNQNIPANLLEDFWLFDASLTYKLSWRSHHLTARFAVNNLTNNYYSYIRYFVMPGRNVALNLSYDF